MYYTLVYSRNLSSIELAGYNCQICDKFVIQTRPRKVRSSLRNTLSKSLEPEPAEVLLPPSPVKGNCGTRGLFPLSSRAR